MTSHHHHTENYEYRYPDSHAPEKYLAKSLIGHSEPQHYSSEYPCHARTLSQIAASLQIRGRR